MTTRNISRMAILFLLLSCAAAHAEGVAPAGGHWLEHSAGFFVSRPDIRLSTDNAGRLSAKADLTPGIYALARENNWPLRELSRDVRTLETVFNQLATTEAEEA